MKKYFFVMLVFCVFSAMLFAQSELDGAWVFDAGYYRMYFTFENNASSYYFADQDYDEESGTKLDYADRGLVDVVKQGDEYVGTIFVEEFYLSWSDEWEEDNLLVEIKLRIVDNRLFFYVLDEGEWWNILSEEEFSDDEEPAFYRSTEKIELPN